VYCNTPLSLSLLLLFRLLVIDIKRIQRDAAATRPNSKEYDYIRDEMADRLVDRLLDIKREFKTVLDLGCHSGHILKSLQKQAHRLGEGDTFMGIESLTQVDRSGMYACWLRCLCLPCLNNFWVAEKMLFRDQGQIVLPSSGPPPPRSPPL
jgi:hypothetical protein